MTDKSRISFLVIFNFFYFTFVNQRQPSYFCLFFTHTSAKIAICSIHHHLYVLLMKVFSFPNFYFYTFITIKSPRKEHLYSSMNEMHFV